MKWILCLLGWHQWTWKFEKGTYLVLCEPPPDNAVCSRCGVRYKEKNKP